MEVGERKVGGEREEGRGTKKERKHGCGAQKAPSLQARQADWCSREVIL